MGVDVGTDRLRDSTVGCRTEVGGANVSDPSAPLRYGRDDGVPFSSFRMVADPRLHRDSEQVKEDGGRLLLSF